MSDTKRIICANSNAEFVETCGDDFFKREKVWKIIGDDKSIKEVWLHELRQLNKIRGYPYAEEFLVLMTNARKEGDEYIIEYDSDQNSYILSEYLNSFVYFDHDMGERNFRRKEKHWLHRDSLKTPKNRVFFWEKMIDLMSGIEILHSHGVLHRNISLQSVIVSDLDTDFKLKLTGFERSLNLIIMPVVESDNSLDIHPFFSYNTDWMYFGFLLCHLLNGSNDVSVTYSSLGGETLNYLTKKEVEFINSLLKIQSVGGLEYPLEPNELKNMVRDIIYDLEISSSSFKEDYILCVDLNAILKKPFFSINNTYYDFSDIDQTGLLNFIKSDLEVNEKKIFKKEDFIVLAGKDLFYVLRKFVDYRSRAGTWKNAFCNNIFDSLPDSLNRNDSQYNSFSINIEVVSSERRSFNVVSESQSSWEEVFKRFKPLKGIDSTEVSNFLSGMALNYALEVVNYKANLFSVSASLEKIDSDFSVIKLNLIEKYDQTEKNIENTLRLGNPKSRLDRLLFIENIEGWTLLLPEGEEIELTFNKNENLSDGYIFHTKEPYFGNYFDKNLILMISLSKMTEKSLKRKSKALNHLVKNIGLIKSLADPVKNTNNQLYEFESVSDFSEMDTSKQKVFKEILNNNPNYVVQGPPGVGKTFLITTILQQIFQDEPYSKVILSAQSHSTVEVLFKEVKKLIKKQRLPKDLIIIDNFNKEESLRRYDLIKEKVDYYKLAFLKSNMFHEAERKHGENFIKKITGQFNDEKFYDKILSAANLVLATTNSWTIEELYESNCQFDMVVIEEAGKASGIDIISPLLLSHKRVMIGDPKQLPPFLSSQIDKIAFSDQEIIYLKDIIGSGAYHTAAAREAGMLDKSFLSKDEDLANINENIHKAFYLFAGIVSKANSFNKKSEKNANSKFGGILNEQYRMNPDVSLLISTVFYEGVLINNEEKENYYLESKNKEFFFKKDNFCDIPFEKGIVWIDIPEPNTNGMISFEKNYENRVEVEILKKIVSGIHIFDNKRSEKKSITVISPYKKQVDLINRFIDKSLIELIDKNGFSIEGDKIAKTVDSFQGGEADIVIISMVRHNNFTPIQKALGFLLDERRLNVMLSRAKHQLIIIGCFGMLEYWTKQPHEIKDKVTDFNIDFLRKLVHALKNGVEIVCNEDEKDKSKVVEICDFVYPSISILEDLDHGAQ